MKALFFSKNLHFENIPIPEITDNEILVKVQYAGICNTDIEITKGYIPGFNGIPGHEFIGHIVKAAKTSMIGKRVTSEINCYCGVCPYCQKSLGRHCPNRTVLGIDRRNGAFAEYIAVPSNTVIEIPDQIPDMTAILIEPLAAALEILDQVEVKSDSSVLLIGDGKLAQLIGVVMHSTECNLTVLGKHHDKISLLKSKGINAITKDSFTPQKFDIVIEASGSPEAFVQGLSYVRPRGTFVLKSTYAGTFDFNPVSIVINELVLIGSRCGDLRKAIEFIQKTNLDLSYLVSEIVSFDQALEAFKRSQEKGVLKIILSME